MRSDLQLNYSPLSFNSICVVQTVYQTTWHLLMKLSIGSSFFGGSVWQTSLGLLKFQTSVGLFKSC